MAVAHQRFVSQYRNYTYGVKTGVAEMRDPQSGAITREGIPDLEAKFTHDLVDEDAIRIAKLDRSEGGLARIKPGPDGRMPPAPFHGMQQDESGRDLPIEIRLSVFDSEIAQLQNGWSDEDTQLVIDKLLSSNRRGTDFQLVEKIPAALPWNNYDEMTDPERVLLVAETIGADLNQVFAYESSHQNRKEILEAINEAQALAGEEIVVSA